MKKTIKSIIQTKEYQKLKRLILGYLWGVIKLRVQNFLNKEQGWVVDVPDDRDILASEIVKGEKPPKTLNKTIVKNIQFQWNSDVFPWASCWPHWASHGIEQTGYINHPSWPEIARQMRDDGLLHSWGSYLVDNAKYPLKKGWITGFYRVTTIDEIKAHLATSMPILVWSNQLPYGWNIEKQRYERAYNKWSFGHLWCLLPEYDEEGVWCADSLVNNNRKVFMKWDLVKYLFPSRLALTTDKKFIKIQHIKKETQEFITETRKQGIKEQTARITLYKWLMKKYKDKKIVLVGMRLWLGMNIEDYML